jgi:hypothetical protein
MEKNNVVFSAENIISTLGINIQDDYNVIFEPDPEAIDITSRFFIEKKGETSSYYNLLFASDNFENSDNPGYVALLRTNMTQDGIVTLKLGMNLPQMNKIMTIVNNYIQFFMVITERTGFYARDTVNLKIMTDYKNSAGLELTNIHIYDMVLYSVFETNYEKKEINIEDVVNIYLSKLGVDKIDDNTDVDALMVLVKMQKILEAMVAI